MLGAEDPLHHGQQRGVLIASPGWIPRLPGPAGEVAAGDQGFGVLGAGDPLAAAAARRTGPGPRPDPPPPGPAGEVPRAVRVSGCSAPETRSRTGSSAAYWSRAAAGSPACPVQQARLPRAARVSGCSAPETRSRPAAARRTGPGPPPIPCLPGPGGEVAAWVRKCPGGRGPETRWRKGSSAASWSRAAAGFPAFPVQ